MSCLRPCLRCCFVTVPVFLWDGVRLLLYVCVLFPAFLRFAWYYFVSADRIVVRYGNQSRRQFLDVYRPINNNNGRPDSASLRRSHSAGDSQANLQEPVVFFCCGGAWLIGYKMWGALLARILAASGITVVVPDYRNYPWGTVPEAVDDVESALQWTLDHMASEPPSEEAEQKEDESSGTDDITEASPLTEVEEARATPCDSRRKKNLVVVGQSAGGHLVTTLLLRKAVEQLNTPETPNENNPEAPSSSSFVASDVSGLISLSAPFHLEAMQDTFRRHGLGEHLVDRMFDGRRDDYDPFVILQQANEMATSPENHNHNNRLGDFLPPIRVYHGTRDKTVPFQGSIDFVEQLQARNVVATYHSYDGWSHTDPILEGPMVADHRFHRDIFDSVLEWTPSSSRSLSSPSWPGEGADRPPPVMRKLCPHFLIKLGHFFMPF